MKRLVLRGFSWLSIGLLAGCSTYSGHKLGLEGTLPPGANGIPYTMTKPEYSLSIAPNSDDPTRAVYTLTKADVPDPNHRYTLALDPTLLTDGKFTLKIGELGNITEATAVTNSRVVATVKSLGKAALEFKKFDAAQRVDLDKYVEFLRVDPGCASVAGEIESKIEALFMRALAQDKDTATEVALNGYFYTSLAQRTCLKAVRSTIENTITVTIKDTKDDFDKAGVKLGTLLSTPSSTTLTTATLTELKAIVGEVPAWIKAKDVGSINSATTYVTKYQGYKEVAQYFPALRDYVNSLLQLDRVKAIAASLDLSQEVWRARYVKWFGSEIERLRFARDIAKTPEEAKASQDEIDRNDALRAQLVGGTELRERLKTLDTFLKEIKQTRNADGTVRYAADEHVKLREERDRIETQLNALVASVVSSDSKGADKAKVKARDNVKVRLASQKFVDSVNENLGLFFSELPEFVLVLKRKDGDRFADLPKRKEIEK